MADVARQARADGGRKKRWADRTAAEPVPTAAQSNSDFDAALRLAIEGTLDAVPRVARLSVGPGLPGGFDDRLKLR
jgi:hypothetical protein